MALQRMRWLTLLDFVEECRLLGLVVDMMLFRFIVQLPIIVENVQ
jgi:hypothetical protein